MTAVRGTHAPANVFNDALTFEQKLYRADITASLAHAEMLGTCNIISKEEAKTIQDALQGILSDIESGKLNIEGADNIHVFVEEQVIKRIGQTGKKLLIARSHNDQEATVLRLYVRESCERSIALFKALVETLVLRAKEGAKYLMPGFTNLNKTQPITCGQYFNAYSEMFLRDMERFSDCHRRANVMPLGSAALAGTSYPIDRELTKVLLGFDEISENSLDAVSDRDFVADYLFAASLAMAHLSRLCEDILLYTSEEFGYFKLPDEATDFSQTKISSLPARVRGRAGSMYGHLTAILTALKGLPLAYQSDLEDKQGFFDAEQTLCSCLAVCTALLENITLNVNRMYEGASAGTAGDVTDYLCKKGMPLDDAQAVTKRLVNDCIQENKTLLMLTLDEFKKESALFEEDILSAVTPRASAQARGSVGGSSLEAVRRGINSIRRRLKRF